MSYSLSELQDFRLGAAIARAEWITDQLVGKQTEPRIYSLTLLHLGPTQDGNQWAATFDVGVDLHPEWYEQANIAKWPTAARGRSAAAAIEAAAVLAINVLKQNRIIDIGQHLRNRYAST